VKAQRKLENPKPNNSGVSSGEKFMDDDILRYTNLPDTIKLAREMGMSNQQIVRLLTGSTSYLEARKTAVKSAPLLDITVLEFMRLRKND
jgi:hypothetical protein